MPGAVRPRGTSTDADVADPGGTGRPEGFRFVDFAARRRPGFRNCVVPVGSVPALVERYGRFGCYSTFYLYDHTLAEYARAHRRGRRPSVAGYDGPVYAPVWPLDVDAPDLDAALGATRAIVDRLTGEWGLGEAGLRVYFSGKKGFHVTVDTRAFLDPTPSLAVPVVLHRLTRRLGRELRLGPGGPLDLTLGDRMRLLRLPNTRHEATALFKVPVSLQELGSLDGAAVRGLAGAPRPLRGLDPTGLLWEGAPPPSARLRAIVGEVAASGRRTSPPPPAGPRGAPALSCVARLALLRRGAPVGQRNNVAIRLASWFREGGLDREEAQARLLRWNQGNEEPLAVEEVRHVILSAYAQPDPYRYGCRDPLIAPLCPVERADRGLCPYHGRLEDPK